LTRIAVPNHACIAGDAEDADAGAGLLTRPRLTKVHDPLVAPRDPAPELHPLAPVRTERALEEGEHHALAVSELQVDRFASSEGPAVRRSALPVQRAAKTSMLTP